MCLPFLRKRQRGVAMVEFTIVAGPLLLAGACAIETCRWMLARQAAGYALFEAARTGVVAQAEPAAMQAALERGLAPWLGVAGMETPGQLAQEARQRLAAWNRRHGQPMARLEQLNPGPADFDDFGQGRRGRRAIDASQVRERHETIYLKRHPGGMGPRSGHTLFDANTLVLRLTLLYDPLLPGLRTVLRQLADPGEPDAYARAARAAGLLVIRREMALPMQSDAREWP